MGVASATATAAGFFSSVFVFVFVFVDDGGTNFGFGFGFSSAGVAALRLDPRVCFAALAAFFDVVFPVAFVGLSVAVSGAGVDALVRLDRRGGGDGAGAALVFFSSSRFVAFARFADGVALGGGGGGGLIDSPGAAGVVVSTRTTPAGSPASVNPRVNVPADALNDPPRNSPAAEAPGFFVDAPRSVNLGVVDACVANDGAVGVGDVNAGVVVVVVVVPGGSRASAASAAAVDRNPAFARCS